AEIKRGGGSLIVCPECAGTNRDACARCGGAGWIDSTGDPGAVRYSVPTLPVRGVSERGSTTDTEDPATSDATRYICAAVHRNSSFAARAHRLLLTDKHRALAPSPGVDLVAVARHTLAARMWSLREELALLALLLAVAFAEAIWTNLFDEREAFEFYDPPLLIGAVVALSIVLRGK